MKRSTYAKFVAINTFFDTPDTFDNWDSLYNTIDKCVSLKSPFNSSELIWEKLKQVCPEIKLHDEFLQCKDVRSYEPIIQSLLKRCYRAKNVFCNDIE